MEGARGELTKLLEKHYRSSGWKVTRSREEILEAVGPHGVKWIGRAVVSEDFESEEIEAEIVELADRRMPEGGELRPLDLLPAEECAEELQGLLERTGLARHPHVSVYSLAA